MEGGIGAKNSVASRAALAAGIHKALQKATQRNTVKLQTDVASQDDTSHVAQESIPNRFYKGAYKKGALAAYAAKLQAEARATPVQPFKYYDEYSRNALRNRAESLEQLSAEHPGLCAHIDIGIGKSCHETQVLRSCANSCNEDADYVEPTARTGRRKARPAAAWMGTGNSK